MKKLQLFNVSDKYIAYLRATEKNVYSNKIGQRKHMRKYLGVALNIQGYNYFIPLSSPKDSDYTNIDGNKQIRKSSLTIIRIISETELKATLRLSNMIPVPEGELQLYDLDNEQDIPYKDLVQKELIYIRKNKNKILKNAEIVYKQKKSGQSTAGYMNSILDFENLKKIYNDYII